MIKVEVTYNNGKKRVYKTKFNILNDSIYSLPYVMFEKFPTLLDMADWAKSKEKIVNKLGDKFASFEVTKIDGRKKETKYLEYFSWKTIFEEILA